MNTKFQSSLTTRGGLKIPIMKWNKEVFGDIDSRIKALASEVEVESLDQIADHKLLEEYKLAKSPAIFLYFKVEN